VTYKETWEDLAVSKACGSALTLTVIKDLQGNLRTWSKAGQGSGPYN
jgi:hypothetical protein